MKPIISIIVPVYNVEQYLDRCINSLIKQTYSNLDIILVDDGSPDNCPAFCDAWAQKDSRIRVFHKKNGGLSDARNFGVIHALGEYITFVDSDDYVAPNYMQYLYDLMLQTGADISCCNIREVFGDEAQFEQQPDESVRTFTNQEACVEMYYELRLPLVVAVVKLYCKKLVLDNPFPVGRLHEDEATTYKMLYESSRVAVGTQELYAYYKNDASITHTRGDKNKKDILLSLQERMTYFQERREWRLYAYAADAYIVFLMTTWNSGKQKKAGKLLLHNLFNSKIRFKTKIKMLYFTILGRLP